MKATGCGTRGHTRPGTCDGCGDHICALASATGPPIVRTCLESCGTACPCECGKLPKADDPCAVGGRGVTRRNPTPLRIFDALPEAGELVLSKEAGGWRHFLEGRPVHSGELLRFMTASLTPAERVELLGGLKKAPAVAVVVRYEMRVPIVPGPRATYNHTRGDSPLYPCDVCKKARTPVEAVLVLPDGSERVARRSDRFEWKR